MRSCTAFSQGYVSHRYNNTNVCVRGNEGGGMDRVCVLKHAQSCLGVKVSAPVCVCVCVCEREAPAALLQEAPVSGRLLLQPLST